MKVPSAVPIPLLTLLCTSGDAAEPTDSSPSEIPVSTPDAAERLREARRFTAGYCEGLRSLSERYCDTDSIHEEDGISRAKIFPVSLFSFLFLFLPSRCGSLSPRRSIGRQAFGGGVAVAEAGEAAGSWPLTSP